MRLSLKININSLTFLIAFNMLLFIVPVILSVILAGKVDQAYGLFLYLFGGLRGAWVDAGDIWRVVTSAFLHVDIIHLGANMIALYQLGRIVLNYYGGKMLFLTYIFCGISGSVFSLIFVHDVATVGASGAVFGLVGVLLAGSLKNSRFGVSLPFGAWDILPLVIYSFLVGITPGSPVNNWAHLGGFLLGLILGRVFDHNMNLIKRPAAEKFKQVLYYVSIVLFVGAYVWMILSIPAQLGFKLF